MPTAQNIELNNAQNVTKTFQVAAVASGTAPALYLLREGANQSVFPKLEISSRKNGTADARKVRMTLNVPSSTVDANGVTRKSASILFIIDVTVPDLVPDSVRDDAIAYVGSALFNPQLMDTFKTGFAPT